MRTVGGTELPLERLRLLGHRGEHAAAYDHRGVGSETGRVRILEPGTEEARGEGERGHFGRVGRIAFALTVAALGIPGARHLERPKAGMRAEHIGDQRIERRTGAESLPGDRRGRALHDDGRGNGVRGRRSAVEPGVHAAVDVDLVPEGGERLELDSELIVLPGGLRLPAAGVAPAAVEPGAEAHRQGLPARGQPLTVLIEEAIEKGERETDRRAVQHAAQHTSAAELLTGTHLAVSPIDPALATSSAAGGAAR